MAWEAAKLLSAVAQFIDDCLECVKRGNQLKTRRQTLSPRLRFAVLQRDGMRCTSCGLGAIDRVKLHVDHIEPVSKGGSNDLENLHTLCESCNLGKSDQELV
jgi:5-methylcytosine-specific restriction endonuclease McrA